MGQLTEQNSTMPSPESSGAQAGEGKTPLVDNEWARLVEKYASISNDCKELTADTKSIHERSEPLRKIAVEALRLWNDLHPDLTSALERRANLRTRIAEQDEFMQPALRKKLAPVDIGLAGLEMFMKLIAIVRANVDPSDFAAGMDNAPEND